MKKLIFLITFVIVTCSVTAQSPERINGRDGRVEYVKEYTNNGYIIRDRSGSVVLRAVYRGDKVYIYDRNGKLVQTVKR